jgi:thiopurine S-methyltransferase
MAGVFLKGLKMDHSFWHDRWESGRIGFHQAAPNALLITHFPALDLPEGARVFMPLCGKTRDIAWLLGHGFRVAGAELSELAIAQLFEELGVSPTITELGALKRYSTVDIDIFVGDIFALDASLLGRVEGVFDRAALVALPEGMRDAYTAHLVRLTASAPQLLICFEYEQSLQNGPPFSIGRDEIERHYANAYEIENLAQQDVEGGTKGVAASETVWLLRPR